MFSLANSRHPEIRSKNGLCQTNQAIHLLFLYIVLHFWKIELTLHSNSKGVCDTRPAGACRSVPVPEFPPYYISLLIIHQYPPLAAGIVSTAGVAWRPDFARRPHLTAK